jgi:hypothetical protein
MVSIKIKKKKELHATDGFDKDKKEKEGEKRD